jgi:WXG100 family type VII secretion target
MTGISMSYSNVAQLAQDVKTAANHIQQELDDLKKRVADASTHWNGETKEAYARLQADWDHNVQDLHQHLNLIAAEVGRAPDSYHATDKKIAGKFVI